MAPSSVVPSLTASLKDLWKKNFYASSLNDYLNDFYAIRLVFRSLRQLSLFDHNRFLIFFSGLVVSMVIIFLLSILYEAVKGLLFK